MAFDLSRVGGSVSNFISAPHGTDYVSTIDDSERATREHFVECMKKISGYPEVDTVCVKVWTTATKPSGHSCGSDRVLLGYNSDLNALEVISNTGDVLDLTQAIALVMYPVGSYYETSDPDFDPNEAWGGTWVLDTPGRVMVAQGRKQDANGLTITGSHLFEADEIGGEETHNLIRAELPIHYHPHRHPHTHELDGGFIQTAGTGDTVAGYLASTGSVAVKINSTVKTELHDKENYAYSMKEVSNEEEGWFAVGSDFTQHGMVDADTPKPNDSRTVTEDLLMHVGSAWQRTVENSQTSANEHNNLQPYKVCYRWHRIPDPVEEEEEENNG